MGMNKNLGLKSKLAVWVTGKSLVGKVERHRDIVSEIKGAQKSQTTIVSLRYLRKKKRKKEPWIQFQRH